MSTASSQTLLNPLINEVGDESLSTRSPMSLSVPYLSSSFRVDDSDRESAEGHEELAIKTTSLVRWGIYWKQPALMIAFALCGLTGAFGHHLYYHLMDKKVVSSTETQQWPLRFGTAFSVFIVAMLRAAVIAAYNQYIWKMFRDKLFSVADLDKIFSLTSDFTSFLSLALFKQGLLVMFLASLCW
jgi:hypothetical protein